MSNWRRFLSLILAGMMLVSCGGPAITKEPSTVYAIPVKRVFNHAREITVTYDKFSNVTVVKLAVPFPKISTIPNQIQAIGSYTGTTPITPDAVDLTFVSMAPQKQFPSTGLVGNALLDDSGRQSFLLGNISQPGSGYVLEFLVGHLPTTDFLQMINAKKVEIKIFTAEFQVDEEELEALRDFATRLAP